MVNTAVARPDCGRAGDRARRRGHAAGDRAGDPSTRTRAIAELKGKTEPVRLWRALPAWLPRVGGALRPTGLEAPFVGRDRELRVLKDLLHVRPRRRARRAWSRSPASPASASRGSRGSSRNTSTGSSTRHLVASGSLPRAMATGSPTGRSRRWSACGPALPRTRSRERARGSSRRASSSIVLDADERPWVEPRLAHLLGLEELRRAGDRSDLFAAWRLFFERLAGSGPTVLLVRGPAVGGPRPARLHRLPARVVARLADLRDDAGPAGAARAASDVGCGAAQLHLALPRAALAMAMAELLEGLVPGLAGDGCATRCGSAPRDPAVRNGDGADAARPWAGRPGGTACTGAPASSQTSRCRRRLHALIAARLDGLGPTSGARAGRGGARQDLHATGTRRAFRASPEVLEPRLRALVPQGAARDSVRSALPGARPIRFRAGPGPHGRVRDARATRPQDPPPRRRRLHDQLVG